MSTITLPNIRVGSDLTVRVRLKDGGVAIDWSTLTNIRAHIYSDAQRALAGRCSVSVDAEDPTVLVCVYAATKPQYLGVNRIIVQANYMGETKTYDKPVFSYVRWTADQEGEEITIEDPDIAVELEVEDVTSSILQNILDACIKATEEAREVVDTSRGPRGYSAYEIAVQDGFEGTEEEWLESLQGETGPQGPQGEQGETGPAGVTDVEVDVSPSSGTPAGTASVYDGTLSLHFTGLKGQSAYEVAVENGFEGTEEEWLASLVGPQGQQGIQGVQGPQGIQGATGPQGETGATGATGAQGPKGDTGDTPDFSIGTVQTGAAGSQASASITGTAAAPVLNLVIPKGDQGNTGSSVDYPYELVNNRTTNDATKGLSAAEGKRLGDDLSQLEAKLYSFGGLLVPLLKKIVYKDENAESYINAIDVLLNSNEIESISAVYTQPGVIYAGEPLEDLEDGLVVTAHFSSGDDVVVASGYELSGSLTAGTSTITVTYLELTATFNVSVTDDVYYKTGDLLPVQVGLRNSIDTAAGLETSYAVNGVQYIFSSAFATGGNATTKKRCAYYLFDILLTAGKTYKHTIEFDSLPANNDILCSLAYYDETYHLAGVANVKQTCNYSSNVTAPAGWVSATKNGNVVSFDEQVPTGYVGARLSMKMAISGTDKDWPTTLTVKRYIIQEIE